jgi:site-specific DNA-methyltransferase (adenine-specific)
VSDWTLHTGDCLNVLPTMPAESVQLMLADMPYGLTQCRWDSVIPLAPLWAAIRHVLAPKGAVVLTAGQPFTSTLVMSNAEWFRHEWVWLKNRGSNFANTVREPMKEHESVLVFSPGGWTYNPQLQGRAPAGASRARYAFRGGRQSECYGPMPYRTVRLGEMRVPSSWQSFSCEVGLHPTQKPVALMEYLVRTYSNEGDTVLDFCMGSGTTGVACVNAGRRFIGVEKDPAYVDIARKRLAGTQGPLFAHAEGGGTP